LSKNPDPAVNRSGKRLHPDWIVEQSRFAAAHPSTIFI
jgi:hypothetical protein